jgi:hypothetical protein
VLLAPYYLNRGLPGTPCPYRRESEIKGASVLPLGFTANAQNQLSLSTTFAFVTDGCEYFRQSLVRLPRIGRKAKREC